MSTSCNYSIIINNHSAINVLHRHFGYNVAFHDVFTIKLIIRGFRGVLGDPKNKNYRLLLKSFHAFVHCSSPVRTLDSGRLGLSPFIHFFASPIWSIRPLLVTILRKPCLARTFYFTFGVWSSLFVGLRPFSSRNVNFSPPPPPPLCCLLVLAGCIGGEWPRLCALHLIRLCLFRQTIKIILSYICVWLSLSLFLGFYSSFGRFYRGPGCTGGQYSAFSRRPADLINPSLSIIGFRASILPPPGSAFPLVRTPNYSNINTKLPHIFGLHNNTRFQLCPLIYSRQQQQQLANSIPFAHVF